MAFLRKRQKLESERTNPQMHATETEEELLQTVRILPSTGFVDVGLYSAIGSRAGQQDAARVSDGAFYERTKKAFAVLCDGMGGLSGGERASQLCVTALYSALQQQQEALDGYVQAFYRTMIRRLDAAVHGLKDEDGNLLGAGTTLASVCLLHDRLYWASVGDSRIYILRDGALRCLTEDHNYYKLLCERVRHGLLTKEEADRDPKREALISYIGIGGVEHTNLCETPLLLQNDDWILLCSDGLYRTLSEAEIVRHLQFTCETAPKAAQALVDAALAKQKRHQDNTTVVLLHFGAL